MRGTKGALIALAVGVSLLSRSKRRAPRPAPVAARAAPELATAPQRRSAKPRELGDLPATDWRATFKRTLTEFREDDLTDWGAALTYYAVLSIFPSVIVLIAILGLFGQYPQTSNALLGIVGDVGPSSAVDTFRGPIEDVVKGKGGAGALLGLGWSQRSGRLRATSARSSARPTSSTRSARAGRSGSSGRSRSW